MHFIPGLKLRASEQSEILGIDDAEMGEFAYDYVGLEQEIGHNIHTGVNLGGNREPKHEEHDGVKPASQETSRTGEEEKI